MSDFFANKKILLTGGAGFLGRHVLDELIKRGVSEKQVLIPRSKDYDLIQMSACEQLVQGVDIVIHLAANVGGIGYNRENPGKLFYDNIMMGTQLIEAARQAQVEKFTALGTICAYPKFTPVPFKEDDIWNGYPEETNAPYGLAKKMLLVQLQAYRDQYGFNGIYLLPTNLYGPHDHFNPMVSHVIPALIKKVYDAKQANASHIEAWGDGSPTREFLFVKDAARGIVEATEKYNDPDPVNLGTGNEIAIKDLTELICELMGYTGEIKWDPSQPNGQPRRQVDASRAKERFGFVAETSFREGLKETIDWYEQASDEEKNY